MSADLQREARAYAVMVTALRAARRDLADAERLADLGARLGEAAARLRARGLDRLAVAEGAARALAELRGRTDELWARVERESSAREEAFLAEVAS